MRNDYNDDEIKQRKTPKRLVASLALSGVTRFARERHGETNSIPPVDNFLRRIFGGGGGGCDEQTKNTAGQEQRQTRTIN